MFPIVQIARLVSGLGAGPIARKFVWLAPCLLMLAGAVGLLAQEGKRDKGKPAAKVSSDPEIRKIQFAFVQSAEALAKKYETKGDVSKAKDVYEEILKLAPDYEPANKKYEELSSREAEAKVHTTTIKATEGWQDVGVTLLPGRPVTIRAQGQWTFNLNAEVGPDGLKIPKELRDFDPGALVGVIVDEETPPEELKPFMVGLEKKLDPETKGRLRMSMYDNNPKDNAGELTIEIRGTFELDKNLETPGKKKKTK